MVMDRSFRHFLGDESGISLTEGLISLPIVMLAFAAFVEFGYAMFQWNQTVKALQYGARLAAVSDPVATSFDPNAIAADGVGGTAIPAGASFVCGPALAGCNTTALNRIVEGAGGRPGMRDLNWRIAPENVVVTYELSGLGYYGRPMGAIATIRLEVRNIDFDLPILGGLLGLDNITVPAHPVTITTEDLKTCSTC
ncbi:TadE/TadG family type IV pilus assembly protein [Ensifer sp. B1-9]|uniref:TadE/TadG family type IV pilus assembly protein n=1 Tax=Ensifer sp. B1-9 TaxID=3141455 RepID=UPI003D1D6C3C